MTLTLWIRVTAGIVVLAIITAIGVAWRAEMHNRAELASELAATKTALEAAGARQRDRDARLAGTLAEIARQKRTEHSPSEIVKDLPLQMHLPAAMKLQSASELQDTIPGGLAAEESGPGVSSSGLPVVPDRRAPTADIKASNVQAVIPGEDLKPMYDFALDCQACQASLAVSRSNLADEQGKTKALTKERDAALRVARGGSVLQRVARASKWLLIGAAAGALAARAAH